MKTSATLKIAGKYLNSKKSKTVPNLILSIMFPRAPPVIIPMATLKRWESLLRRFGTMLTTTTTKMDAIVIKSVCFENIPKAIPVLVVLLEIQSIPGTRGILKIPSIPAMRFFVN